MLSHHFVSFVEDMPIIAFFDFQAAKLRLFSLIAKCFAVFFLKRR